MDRPHGCAGLTPDGVAARASPTEFHDDLDEDKDDHNPLQTCRSFMASLVSEGGGKHFDETQLVPMLRSKCSRPIAREASV